MNELKVKIEDCFDRLQHLVGESNLSNMETLVATLYDLREVYNKLNEMEENKNAGSSRENRSAADL